MTRLHALSFNLCLFPNCLSLSNYLLYVGLRPAPRPPLFVSLSYSVHFVPVFDYMHIWFLFFLTFRLRYKLLYYRFWKRFRLFIVIVSLSSSSRSETVIFMFLFVWFGYYRFNDFWILSICFVSLFFFFCGIEVFSLPFWSSIEKLRWLLRASITLP